jgi:hypothetical protein
MINPVEEAIEHIRQLTPRGQAQLAAMLVFAIASKHEPVAELDYETRAIRRTASDDRAYDIIAA